MTTRKPTEYVVEMPAAYGRTSFWPSTGAERLAALCWIVNNEEPARIDGTPVQVAWARMLVDLYDSLPDDHQTLMLKVQVGDMRELLPTLVPGYVAPEPPTERTT